MWLTYCFKSTVCITWLSCYFKLTAFILWFRFCFKSMICNIWLSRYCFKSMICNVWLSRYCFKSKIGNVWLSRFCFKSMICIVWLGRYSVYCVSLCLCQHYVYRLSLRGLFLLTVNLTPLRLPDSGPSRLRMLEPPPPSPSPSPCRRTSALLVTYCNPEMAQHAASSSAIAECQGYNITITTIPA